jgi:hypothetical protein
LNVLADRVFSDREYQSLNDTLAILTFKSGAARKAGRRTTVSMILIALVNLKDQGWFSGDRLAFWSDTLAQLEETAAMLRVVGHRTSNQDRAGQ